jgi:hypothetical protein
MEFLGVEVDGALTAQKIRREEFDHSNYIPSAAALHVNSKHTKSGRKDRHAGDHFCVFCESKGQWAQECKVTEVSERREKLKSAHCCFLCLNRGHNARVCSKKGKALCTRCKGARCKLTRCVLDAGSQTSFVAKTLIDDLKLEVVDRRDLVVSAFESQSSDSSPCRVARFCAKSIWNNVTVPITAFESANALCPHPTVPHDVTNIAQTRKLQLADPREGDRDLPIEILIGGDHYWRRVNDASTICLSSSLVLLPTKFGWI